MNDKLIAMARQAGFLVNDYSMQVPPNYICAPAPLIDEFLESFAVLVAADAVAQERKANTLGQEVA